MGEEKFKLSYPTQDIFFRLPHPTIAEIRSIFEWANKHALKTHISCLEVSKSWSRIPSSKSFDDVVDFINRQAKPYFRIVLRKNMNWFAVLAEERHIEDVIEIAIRGIEIDEKEYFIQCYLKKELLGRLKSKFAVTEIFY